MIARLTNIMRENHVGLLVVDEIHHLLAKGNGTVTLLKLLVHIENQLKIPVLLIGTPKALRIMSTDLSLARRSTGIAMPEWYPPVETDVEWVEYTDKLWQYNYLSKQTRDIVMPADIRHKLFDLTQGITGLTKVLFALAQKRAMNDETEVMTPELLDKEFKQAFVLNEKYLSALRNADYEALRSMPDVFGEGHVEKLTVASRVCRPADGSKVARDQAAGTAATTPPKPEQAAASPENSVKPSRLKDAPALKGTLMFYVQQGKSQQLSGYESLKAAGVIRNKEVCS